jgi:hypothetical protein
MTSYQNLPRQVTSISDMTSYQNLPRQVTSISDMTSYQNLPRQVTSISDMTSKQTRTYLDMYKLQVSLTWLANKPELT